MTVRQPYAVQLLEWYLAIYANVARGIAIAVPIWVFVRIAKFVSKEH